MVVPMKKIFLVVQWKHEDESLRTLRKIGVVHLERRAVSSEALTQLFELKAKADTALRTLRLYKKEEEGAPAAPKEDTGSVSSADALTIISKAIELAGERKSLLEELSNLKKELSRVEEWGNFNPLDLSSIQDSTGQMLFLYKLNRTAVAKLGEECRYISIGGDKNFLRLVVLDQEIPGRSPFAAGDNSLSELNSLIEDVQNKLLNVDDQLVGLAENLGTVEKKIEAYLYEIEFESAKARFGTLDDVPAESAVSWITGYVPKDDLGLIKRGASENGWALLAEDPASTDPTPTKLKNNRFVNLLSPITNFLNISPGYDEPDISAFFLFFLTIFFGMIFGDAAYGALFLIVSIIGICKTAKKGVPIGLKLLLLLGTSNLIWGILTCSWFGLESHQVPLFLQNLSLYQISNVTADMSELHAAMVQQNLMIVCFTLALIHLSIGHIISIGRTRGLRILAELGGIAMLLGMYGIVLALIASNEYQELPLLPEYWYLLGAGFFFVFVFSGYNGSIGGSILDGFKNIISMILGVANVFSDTMSYIRLWAVGLAGASIAMTVTGMAGPMLGNFVFFIFGIIILAIGHGLNVVLNVLAVLVHGVRLNTLEFSGHVGLTWSGTKYNPFKERD